MRFKYKTTNIGSDKIPLLDVIITNPENNRKVTYPALLDSGAFMNVFHSDIAQILGVDLSKIKREVEFGGIGTTTSTIKGKPYVVNLMVAQKDSGVQVFFVDKDTLEKIDKSDDHGNEIIRGLESENKKLDKNYKEIPTLTDIKKME